MRPRRRRCATFDPRGHADLKRSEELAVLSREHHIALELALRLRRATEDQVEPLVGDARGFWRRESIEHFRLEEEFVLPSLARHATDDAAIARTRRDHAELRRRFGQLEYGRCDLSGLRELGALLAEHVRFEERVLFPRVEATLAAEELAVLGRQLRTGET
jgi:hypothetical protein